MIDYHCHILPQMDDGAETPSTSEKMLKLMKEQGVNKAILTPHYYMQQEDVSHFLMRRDQSYKALQQVDTQGISFVLAAEVLLYKNISKINLFEKLTIANSKYILIEMPYCHVEDWMVEELNNIYYNFELIPVFAHLDRYIKIFSKQDYEELFNYNCIYQFNDNELFNRKVKTLLKDIYSVTDKVIFGSDTHNLSTRAPIYKNIKKGIEKGFIKWYNIPVV